jgi:threonine-phosphate decarboxylase
MKKDALKPELHGGNIYRLAEKLGVDESEIIDFSASINPLGMPKSVSSVIAANISYLSNYPDPDTTQLRIHLAKHLGIASSSIICGNGSTELIYLIVRALRPEKVLIPMPTFSEYEKAVGSPDKIKYHLMWEKNGFRLDIDKFINDMSGSSSAVTYKSALTTSVDVTFLCNPNNPTGKLLKKDDLMKISNAAKSLKCYLVVDEAFVDFTPGYSIIKEVANNPYLIVLRSMTKFYGMPGLRIGYAAAAPSVIEMLKAQKEPWTVNTLAQVAGIVAVNDESYAYETLKLIRNEKNTFEEGFKLLGINYVDSDANFYLIKIQRAKEIAAYLMSRGIMVRDCSNFNGLDDSYIRVAVKGNRDNMRLIKELANFLNG